MGSSKATRCALGALATVLGGWAMHPVAASAETGGATIIHPAPGQACAGEGATLAWSAPEGVTDVTGYRITQSITTPSTPQTITTDVGGRQRSLAFTLPFGLSTFQIRVMTTSGVADSPYTSASIMGNQAPKAMSWASAGAAIGDGTATVPFKWYGPMTWSTTGGVLPTTIQVVASTGGSIVSPAPHDGAGVATLFTGLANGSASTFSAVTSNGCGSSAATGSPSYVPGIRPSWTQANPPLSSPRNTTYRYAFAASGDPAVTYRLVSAPAWLTIGSGGQVTGTPPKATTTFTYSVAASNGVGITGIMNTDIAAGPFTVRVAKR